MRLNRRVPNGTHGGVRGRGYSGPSYSIVDKKMSKAELRKAAGIAPNPGEVFEEDK